MAERFRGKIWYQNLPRKLGRVQREERRGKGARGKKSEVSSRMATEDGGVAGN